MRIGIELGLQVHLKEYFKELTRRYPFDFVIGSTHFIDRKDPAYPEFFEERGEANAYLQYFETTLDNVSHLDDYDVAGSNATRPDCGRASASPTRRQMC